MIEMIIMMMTTTTMIIYNDTDNYDINDENDNESNLIHMLTLRTEIYFPVCNAHIKACCLYKTTQNCE